MISTMEAHAAVEARDARFDGRFFTGVKTTGIYCRCICPARTPKPENRRFFPSAAAAEKAGFRPCLLCRPERAPGLSPIEAGARLAARALARIEAGALEDQGLEALAADLGVTGRHLRRVIGEAYGASPIDIAQTSRLLAAKRLLRESDLPITEIAYAAGFRSLRRFNAVLKERYGLTPQRLRGRRAAGASATLTLDLTSRGAFDFAPTLAFLNRRALIGLETVSGSTYARTIEIGGARGWMQAAPHEGGVRLSVSDTLVPVLRPLVAAVRGAFDLDADMHAIDAHLPSTLGGAGMRIPGGLDAFEIAVRAILGQQVSLTHALTLAQRLLDRYGAPLDDAPEGLMRLFPRAEILAAAGASELATLGMPLKRAEALAALSRAAAEGRVKLVRGGQDAARAALADLPGVGPWTIEYVALRALGDPDAFPGGDAVIRVALGGADSQAWRPWRAYAAVRLWARAGERVKGQDR